MTNEAGTDRGGNGRRPWIPEIVGDRYQIERELGSGASAVTVLATDQTLGRRVAVKILKPESELDPEFFRRFSREARAAASVNHQNVVNVYDVGQDGDLLYLVMQYVEGTDLKRVIDREGALPWRRAVEITRDVLSGLTAIHTVGIVHRDIKPQNVLIGDDGSVRVTDFGVVHVELASELTTAGMTVGTATYMAPEQAQGNPVTPAADVYAVGVMLYEMVSGRVPFSAATSMAVMLAHIQQQAQPPEAPSNLERLPDGVVAVIRQAMSKDPESRFRSATAMGSALANPDSWRATGAAGANPGQTGRTQVVPAMQSPRASPSRHRTREASYSAPPRTGGGSTAGKGLGAFLVAMLVILALGLVATAGVLWYMGQQDDGDSSPGPAQNQEQAPGDGLIGPGRSDDDDELRGSGPGQIDPIETDAPVATEIPAPTDEPVIEPPTLEPEPTSPMIEPSGDPTLAPALSPTVIVPSTERDESEGIIDRIENPTVPSGG
ncbi:MAG: protein kinase [Chloroflexota bacterium]|nr:protein kinase [Chloroflexota bacterium]